MQLDLEVLGCHTKGEALRERPEVVRVGVGRRVRRGQREGGRGQLGGTSFPLTCCGGGQEHRLGPLLYQLLGPPPPHKGIKSHPNTRL